jgi:hypothetical protein
MILSQEETFGIQYEWQVVHRNWIAVGTAQDLEIIISAFHFQTFIILPDRGF